MSPPLSPGSSTAGPRRGTTKQRSVLPWWIVVAALAVGIAIVVLRAEPFVPTVTLEAPLDTIGRATALRVAAHDRGSGLADRKSVV